MTQDNGQAATGSQAPAPMPAAPVPAPAQTPQAVPAAAPQADDGFIRVPRESLKDWGGDWHKVAADAKQVREAEQFLGKPFGQFWTDITSDPQPAEPPPAAVPSAPATDPAAATPPQPVTLDAVGKVVADQFKARDAQTAKEREQAELARTANQAMEIRTRTSQEILTQVGFAPDASGQLPPEASLPKAAWDSAVDQAILETIPHYLRNRPEVVAYAARHIVPSETVLSKAKEIFTQTWTGLQQRILSAAANGQSMIPTASLGAGAAGRPMSKPFDEMSRQEKRDFLLGRAR